MSNPDKPYPKAQYFELKRLAKMYIGRLMDAS
jgi:hypothetical protein